ncbi:hypothetical protein BJ138DRAFT_1109336 [Hygrophoropsis aurantiaca]|uniref:Uncharacterized protein n=1 Tax=Hygrophoropsis aurantiaca TaxID=72124 RepID=A0ACB8AS88_9AGAM|nr:hypothetical protein BJ138DRAFT_1109336 [Hygrophoropsis aurantiaca]
MSKPINIFPGAWPESARPSLDRLSSAASCAANPPPGLTEVDVAQTSSPSAKGNQESHLAHSLHISEKPQPPPLRIIVPPSAYCPFSTDLSDPISPLALPPSFLSLNHGRDTSPDFHSSSGSHSSFVSVPGVVSLSSSPVSAGPIIFASPTSSHCPPMPPTPESSDGDNGAAVTASPFSTESKSPVPLHDRVTAKEDALKEWEVAGETWLTGLGGDSEADRIFRRNLYDASILTDSSPGSTPALSLSPAGSFLPTHMPSLAFSLTSTPTSSSAPISPTASTHGLPPSSRLALQPTSTIAFPSSVDRFEQWREDVTGGPIRAEDTGSETVQASSSPIVNSPTTTHSSADQEGTIDADETLQIPANLSLATSALKSRNLLQRARDFGGRMKRLVSRRHSRSNIQVSRPVTSSANDNESIILIIAPPPPYEDRLSPSDSPIPSNFSVGARCHRRPSAVSSRSFQVTGGYTSSRHSQNNSQDRLHSMATKTKEHPVNKQKRRFSTGFPGFSALRK